MSLDVLAAGRLLKAPEQRIGKTGRPFALASLAVAMEGEDSVICSVIAFRESAVQALAALDAGDACAVAGKAKVTTWTNREGETKAGLSIVAEAVLSAYHVRRKRQAVQGDDAGSDDPIPAPAADRRPQRPQARRGGSYAQRPIPETVPRVADMGDDLPWAGEE